MLKVFRDNLKYLSWILWLVIVVFILFVFVDFGGTVQRGGSGIAAAAEVGDQEISYAEFEQAYRRAEDYYRQTFGGQFSSETARQMGLPRQVMDGLITEQILLAEAARMGLETTDEEVREAILEQTVFQDENGQFIGEEQYQSLLRSNGYTIDSFEATMRSDLAGQKLRTVLAANLYVPESAVEEAYREQVEKAKVRYLHLPADRFAAQVVLEDSAIAEYFAEHQEQFRLPERRTAHYLLIDPDELAPTLEIGEPEIRDYYDTHQDEFTSEEQIEARHILLRVTEERPADVAAAQLVEIRERIADGESFAALAEEFSDDTVSAAQGGNLGFFGRGQMIQAFEDAAFAAQPGELVGPIRTDFGYHLIEVQDRSAGGTRSFDEVSEEIREQLLGERAAALAESTAGELADRLSREEILGAGGLRELADSEAGVTFHETPAFAREDNVPGIGRATAFTVAAFDLTTDEVSSPVRVAEGWAVLRLGDAEEPRLPELDEVREEVESALRGAQRVALAEERLAAARLEMTQGKTLEEIAAELELELEESNLFGRQAPIGGSLGQSPGVAAAALELEAGDIGGPLTHEDGVVLFEVVERQSFEPAAFDAAKQQTRSTLESQRLNQLLGSLVAERRESLGVRYDAYFIENFDQPEGGTAAL